MLTFLKFFLTFLAGACFGFILLALLSANIRYEIIEYKDTDEENKDK